MKPWLFYALLSAVSAAFVSIFGKMGLAGLDSNAATAVRAVIMAAFLVGVVAVEGHGAGVAAVFADRRALLWIALSGIAGALSWHLEAYGPTQGSFAWNIGIGLGEACRGHGVGTVAQRLLAEWLLASTPLDRIEASTDVENVAEQRSLEKAGFTREGTLRGAQARADGQHDLYSYSLLRSDLVASE